MKISRDLMGFKSTFSEAIALCLFLFAGLFFSSGSAQAANAALSITPNSGQFVVDSTFDVSVYLDTQGQSVNTIELSIKYPPDKLQLVSSSTGKSIIGLWTSQPKFNNQTGVIELTGGIPGGVNVSRGLITTMTFRVKAVGSAVVKFDESRVLLNDGLGTETLTQNYNSIFDLVLPAPAGPIVVSETHPDQTQWYANPTVVLRWGDEGGTDGFSYMISDRPIDIPDEVSEGSKRDIVYKNLGEGRKYFHIRALRDGRWGGATHYALNVDVSEPAEFSVDIVPDVRTSRRQPVVQFATTDTLSGLDHYELKIVPLSKSSNGSNPQDQNQEFFIEVQSPYVTNELELGSYDVIIRAYDNAGNFREVTQRMDIVTAVFRYVSDQGLEIRSLFVIPWYLLWLILALLAILLVYLAYRTRVWHFIIHENHKNIVLPGDLQTQMDELQRYRQKYGKLMSVLVILFAINLFSTKLILAADQQVLGPPLITTVSKNIANEEIFYAGGKAGAANADVVLYLQNLQSAETMSATIKSDKNGDWFYRHDTFLQSGEYLIWAQTKIGDQLSPPSPQIQMSVESTALQFGSTRISYITLFVTLLAIVSLLLLALVAYILYHLAQGKKKHSLLQKEIQEAQESLRRGFAVLNRDIEAELDVIRQAKLSSTLTQVEREKEQQLVKDLKDIEQYMSEEIWDIKEAEGS